MRGGRGGRSRILVRSSLTARTFFDKAAIRFNTSRALLVDGTADDRNALYFKGIYAFKVNAVPRRTRAISVDLRRNRQRRGFP